MNRIKYDLEERTTKFSEEIIDLCKLVNRNTITIPILDQLIRSAISIGANYFEANGAASKKDFKNKITISRKEARETQYWLRLLAKSEETVRNDCRRLWKESQELTLIFSKIALSTK